MSTQVVNKAASDRQLSYIQRLQMEIGENRLETGQEMDSVEASKVIGELIAKTQRNNGLNAKVNEPRLGMAMKECFKYWNSMGRDVLKERKETFIKEVIDTYQLFTEIVQRVEKGKSEA